MASLPANPLDQPPIGKAVGWSLAIAGVTIDHGSCWADIAVSLDSGLSPGSVSLEIRGLSADQFRTIAMARLHEPDAEGRRPAGRIPLEGTLHLYWRDRTSLDGPNPPLAMVVFAVTALSRRSEGMQFVSTIEGRDALYDRIARAVTAANNPPLRAVGPLETARSVLTSGGLAAETHFVVHPPAADAVEGPEAEMVVQSATSVLRQLNALEDAMLQRYARRGRGAYLLHRGKLHVGPFRPIPISEPVRVLDEASGLLSATQQGTESAISDAELVGGSGSAPRQRDVWRVEVVGRTDIAPGDVVRFTVAGEDAALFTGFGLAPLPNAPIPDQTVTLYVSSVRHVSGRNRGWTMTLAGVTIPGEPIASEAWDAVQATGTSVPASGETAPRADPAASVRSRVEAIAANEAASRPVLDVGEVLATARTTSLSGSNVVVAAHSSDLLVGVADSSGAGAARNAEMLRNGSGQNAINAPYVTPFAWGPFGLVLPRYPGTRVMVSYHRGSVNDPVDMGALWRTHDDAATSAPTETEAGDWWLILPAGLSDHATSSLTGTETSPIPEDAKASHDLIDAEGERTIEVSGFTVRAYAAGSMKRPMDRPQPPEGDNMRGGIQIEHVDSGAMIAIATDGKITIKATSELVLEGVGIKLKPGSGTVDVE